jgi:type I restriction enzyme R subunit
MTPEQRARQVIDSLLQAAGWHVCGVSDADINAARGVAVREFPLSAGHGFADYLLYIDGKAAGVIEAKKAGVPLIGVEAQSGRYAQGLPSTLPAWRRPLPFVYESTGIETRFTNGLEKQPRSRAAFAFHQPATLASLLTPEGQHRHAGQWTDQHVVRDADQTETFLTRLQSMPELVTEWGENKLWPAQIQAIKNLEKSLAADKPRALIQMATGSGKTFTALNKRE